MHYSPRRSRATLAVLAAVAALPAAANTPPSVAFKAPAAGAALSGQVGGTMCEVTASDKDGGVARVDFYLDTRQVTTRTAPPYQCAIDTTRFKNGTHTVMAVATDHQGARASTQRSVTIQNNGAAPASSATAPARAAPAPRPAASTSAASAASKSAAAGIVQPADIVGWAHADVPFVQQGGYAAQVVGTHTVAGSIPEGGIHSGALPNGETLRLGKVADPTNSTRKAFAFQLGNGDPHTSGSKRSELSFFPTIEMNRVYWVAVRVLVHDWGNEPSGGLFGTQMHSGDNSRGLSPSFGIYMTGARHFRIETRYSASVDPRSSNSVTVKHGDHAIPFGRWADFVFKFKHNTSGQGLLQAWVDGRQVVDYKGSLGFNTPGYKDYAKFGLYNWGSFSAPRKVLLRSPTVVLDPTGSKYNAATLRAHINR